MVNTVTDAQRQAVLSQMDNDTFAKHAADTLLAAASQKKQTGKIDPQLENEIFNIEEAADERQNFNLEQEVRKRLTAEQMRLLEEQAASRRKQLRRAPAPIATPTVVPVKGATPENLKALQTVFEQEFVRSGQATQQTYTSFSSVPTHLQPALKDFFNKKGAGSVQVYFFNDVKEAEKFVAAGKSLGMTLQLLTIPSAPQVQAQSPQPSSAPSHAPQMPSPPPQPQPPLPSAPPDEDGSRQSWQSSSLPFQQMQQQPHQAAPRPPASTVVAEAQRNLGIQVQYGPQPQSTRPAPDTAPRPRLGQS